MPSPSPSRPQHLDPLAVEILEALRDRPEVSTIVLGGHFALKHYLDYRVTHDVDAWWASQTTAEQRATALGTLREAMTAVGTRHGLELRERTWGDTESLELTGRQGVVFSFQVASRTVELDDPVPSPWPPIGIETLRDNLGAKMSALVARGAPRDFRDVYEVVRRGIASVDDCWELWERKNPGLDVQLAKAQVVNHLEAIGMRRPLESLSPSARKAAESLREWVRRDLARAPGQSASGGP
jgi:hypothetical protein